jgi:hypoxia up-regulated 1
MMRLLLLIATLCALASSAVIGIDFSSGFVKVALVAPGRGFRMVDDETSKRNLPNVVAFNKKGDRSFGNLAKSVLVSTPTTAFPWLQRLVMKSTDSLELSELVSEAFAFAGEASLIDDRGVVGFTVGERFYHVEELLAMILEYIKGLAKADSPNESVRDCVITIPSYWTQLERVALLDAAEMAGLNVLSLLHENTAAAIHYGIDMKFTVDHDEHVVLYNMGSRTTEVSHLHYTSYLKKKNRKENTTVGQLEVLGSVADSSLGGAYFDDVIVSWITERAQGLYTDIPDFDIRSIPKAMAKIRTAAIKAKTVLSANSESVVYVESLYKDRDLRAVLTRAEFLELAQPLLDRVLNPLSALVEEQGLDVDTLEILVIGGGARIPVIMDTLSGYIGGRALRQNLDGDEAVAMGAVFRAANHSTTFQVRKFGLVDKTLYPVSVHLTDLPQSAEDGEASLGEEHEPLNRKADVFTRYHKLGKKKTVTLSLDHDFQVDIEYTEPEGLPANTPSTIGRFTVTGLEATLEDEKYAELLADQTPRVALSFVLDDSGVLSLAKAEASLEEEVQVLVVPEPPKKEKKKKKAKTTTEETPSEEGAAAAEEGAAAAEEGAAEEGAAEEVENATPEADTTEDAAAEPVADEAATEGAESADETAVEAEPQYETKIKTHKIPLKISAVENFAGGVRNMNRGEKDEGFSMLANFLKRDKMKLELAAAKNDLESLVYKVRAAIYDELEPVSTDEEREAVRTILLEAEDWLFDQTNELTRENIRLHTSKIAEVNDSVEKLYFRYDELQIREETITKAGELFAMTLQLLDTLRETKPWISETELEKLFNMTTKAQAFLDEKVEAQALLADTEDPVLLSYDIHSRMQPIAKRSRELYKLKEPPKPKEDKKEKKKKKKKGDKKDDTETTTEETTENVPDGTETPTQDEAAQHGEPGSESEPSESTTTTEPSEPTTTTEEHDEL